LKTDQRIDDVKSDGLLAVQDLVEMFENAEDATVDARQLSERDRDYVDGKQLTDEEMTALAKRKQPAIIINRIKRKVDYLRGHEMAQRVDPRAMPRTPKHEADAEGCEQGLRYVADQQRFDHKRSQVFDNLVVEGMAGYRVGVKEGYDGVDIEVNRVSWDRMFYDPHSSEPDFSDAAYLGVVRWSDYDEAVAQYPDAKDHLGWTLNDSSISDTFDDKPKYKIWADKKRKRVRICQIWVKRQEVWYWAEYTKGGILASGVSPYKTDKGESDCELIFGSAFVNRDNERYGLVREMISPQDEINKRRSKALHLLNTSQIVAEKGAVQDIEKARREAARPDGYIELNPGASDKFKFETRADLATGHMQLLQEAKNEIDMMAGNIALQGNALQKSAASGKAIIASQQGGAMEIAPIMDALRDMDLRVYRAIWARIRQYWTTEKWVRITDDERNIKWLGLNVDPMQVQMMAQQNPEMAQKIAGVVGSVAELDCDIIIDDAPDGLTPQLEQFQALVELKKMDVNNELPFRAILTAMPNLRNKEQVLKQMDEGQQGPSAEEAMQAQMQAAQMQIQMQAQAKQAENQVMLEAEQAKAAISIQVKREESAIDLEQKQAEIEMEMQAKRREAFDAQDVETEGVKKRADADGTTAVTEALGALVDSTAQSNAAIVQAVQEIARATGAPKRIVRGPDGRAVGVEAAL
jgi:hypothetical protein